MATTIYLDEESRNLLKKHKENNPDFNLSAFIQRKIKEDSMEGDNIDISKVDYEISQCELEIEKIERKILYLKERKRAVIETRERQEKENEERIQDYAESLFKYCKIKENDAYPLAIEYFNVRHEKTLTSFIEDKNIQMR